MRYISLGYFCSVASELERLGLRDASFPFDWLISDFSGIIDAIEEEFKDLWTYEYWAQNKDYRNYYKHTKYGFQFYHDFDKYSSFEEQLPYIIEKYNRRIKAFKDSIQEPTTFIRYISDEKQIDGVSAELLWIEDNYDRIMKLLKSYNPENIVVFIANTGVHSSKINIYTVEKDKNDVVARFPIDKNKELGDYLRNVDYSKRQINLAIYEKKKKQESIFKAKKKILSVFKQLFFKEYHHHNVY